MSAGQRRGKAIEIVAHEASRLGIKTTRGRRLEPKHVAEWYDETDSKARDLRAMFHNAVVERLGADVRREIGKAATVLLSQCVAFSKTFAGFPINP